MRPSPSAAYHGLRRNWSSAHLILLGDRLHFWTPEGDAGAARGIEWLEQSGLGPARAVPVAPSLEDAFVALVASLAQSYSTCQVMTHFFRQYLMYVTFEVMEPLWGAFEASVQTASSLDEVRHRGCCVGEQGCCLWAERDHATTALCLLSRQHLLAAVQQCHRLSSCAPPRAPPGPLTQALIVEQHQAFLRRLMKGCLLSRKVVVLRALLALKELALRFVKLSDEAASLRWDALEEEAEQRSLGAGAAARAGRAGLRLGGGDSARFDLAACGSAVCAHMQRCPEQHALTFARPPTRPDTSWSRAQGGEAARAAPAQGHAGPRGAGAQAQPAPLCGQHQVRCTAPRARRGLAGPCCLLWQQRAT